MDCRDGPKLPNSVVKPNLNWEYLPPSKKDQISQKENSKHSNFHEMAGIKFDSILHDMSTAMLHLLSDA